jgi:hypothetical protein
VTIVKSATIFIDFTQGVEEVMVDLLLTRQLAAPVVWGKLPV